MHLSAMPLLSLFSIYDLPCRSPAYLPIVDWSRTITCIFLCGKLSKYSILPSEWNSQCSEPPIIGLEVLQLASRRPGNPLSFWKSLAKYDIEKSGLAFASGMVDQVGCKDGKRNHLCLARWKGTWLALLKASCENGMLKIEGVSRSSKDNFQSIRSTGNCSLLVMPACSDCTVSAVPLFRSMQWVRFLFSRVEQ